jgi:hypothetical protein
MARSVHLFVVVSGFAMMAEGFFALFYSPGWMVQQGAITIRGLLVSVMFGFGVTIVDVMAQRLRTWLRNRTPNSSQEPQVTHTLPSRSIVAVEEKAQREAVEPPLAA